MTPRHDTGKLTDMTTREHELVETFVSLADTLVRGYDIVDFMHTLVERAASILHAVDAGILLPDSSGDLGVVASTSERSELIGLLQLQADEGPCIDAYRTGKVVSVDRIAETYARWPTFATEAAAVDYQSMHAIPMRLREQTIGSLNLFSDKPGPIGEDDVLAAQGLADIATIGILQERSLREATDAQAQLQYALSSRILIEQAKGVLAQLYDISMDEAFRRLRGQARRSGKLLSVVAQDIVESAGRSA